MKNKIIFLLLIITISCSIQAQEKLTYEEMFRWFPEGKYDSVAHYQLGLLHQHPYAILYKNATDKPFFAQIHPMTIPLQDQLLDDISSITILRDVRYVVYKGKQRKFLRGGIQAGLILMMKRILPMALAFIIMFYALTTSNQSSKLLRNLESLKRQNILSMKPLSTL